MNKTKIEWTDYTWNPVTGCLHGCRFCYARKLTQRFPDKYPNGFSPVFFPERLDEPKKLKKPSKIFVVSMGDLFGDWVPPEWQDKIFDVIEECPQHTFQLLTKAPLNMLCRLQDRWMNDDIPGNLWIGHSYTGTYFPLSSHPNQFLDTFRDYAVKFVSFEPLLGPIPKHFPFEFYDWVLVGCQTNPSIEPRKEWVYDIMKRARLQGANVFLKDSLMRYGYPKIQEFPEVSEYGQQAF